MSKLRLFIDNFLVFGVGGIISKLIPLIMVPIVTRIMPSTDYYGISELSNTIVQFGSAFAVMGIYDAMYRMFFDNDDVKYKKSVCSTALVFTICTSVIVFIIMLFFKNVIAQYFFNDKKYFYVVYLSAIGTLVGATNSIVSAPTRMQNKRKVFLIINTISPLLAYLIALPMLFAGYYVVALPLAILISGTLMEISFGVLNKKWFNPKLFDFNLLKQLLVIAVPLLPNFLIYWVFNSCDKVMITNMLGIDAAGIYSVGSKIGQISQLIYIAFAGGWQYFAFSTMNDDNQVLSNSKIFEYLGTISFVFSGFICAWSYIIFLFLFKVDYISGYIVAPYLFLAPLLQMLFQVASNQFLVVKKTWPILFILSLGASVNIIINIYLIPKLGIEGAAIATLIGYVVSDIICVLVLQRMHLILISRRFFVVSFIMCLFIISWRFFFFDSMLLGTGAAIIFTFFMMFLYRIELKMIISLI